MKTATFRRSSCGEDHRLLAAELQRGQKEKHEHILKPLVTVLRKNHDDGIRSIIVAGSLQGGERLDALLRGYGLKPAAASTGTFVAGRRTKTEKRCIALICST